MLQLHLSDQQFYFLRCHLYWTFEGRSSRYFTRLYWSYPSANFHVIAGNFCNIHLCIYNYVVVPSLQIDLYSILFPLVTMYYSCRSYITFTCWSCITACLAYWHIISFSDPNLHIPIPAIHNTQTNQNLFTEAVIEFVSAKHIILPIWHQQPLLLTWIIFYSNMD